MRIFDRFDTYDKVNMRLDMNIRIIDFLLQGTTEELEARVCGEQGGGDGHVGEVSPTR